MIPFISPTDLEALLGEQIPDETALIVSISLDSACERVRSYLGQDVNKVTDDVEVHSGSGRKKLRLRQRPVRSVGAIYVDDVLLDPATYKVRGAIVTLPDDAWTSGNDNVEVTYTHGWDTAEGAGNIRVPADIRLVALLVARRVYESVGASIGAGAIIQETIGDYSYRLSEDAAADSASELLDAERFVLDRYRIELVGDTPTQ